MPSSVSSTRVLEVLHSHPVCKFAFYFHSLEVTINRWCFETLIIWANRVTVANCPVLQVVIRFIIINK